MPNHVRNTVRVIGPQGALRAVADKHIREKRGTVDKFTGYQAPPTTTFDFEAVVPPPAALGESSSVATEGALALVIAAIQYDNRFTSQSYGLMHHGGVPEKGLRLAASRSQLSDKKHAIEWTPGAGQDLLRIMDEQHAARGGWRKAACDWLRSVIECDGHGSWYSWNVAKWGTKWNSYDFVWHQSPELLTGDDDEAGKLVFGFDTAWSVPEAIFRALAPMWPDLQFEVAAFDEGWNFCGEGWFGESLGELMRPFEHFKVEKGEGRSERLHITCYGYSMDEDD